MKSSPAARLKAVWAWIRWPAAVAILWWLVDQNAAGLSQLRARHIDSRLLVAGFLLSALSMTSTFVRWWMLVRAQGFNFRLRDAVRIGYFGGLLNYVAAGNMGADVAKAAMLAREQSSRRLTAAATVVIDRVIGLVALLVTGSLAGLVTTDFSRTPEMQAILSSYHVMGIGGIAAITMLMIPAVTRNPLIQRIPRWPVVGRFAGELINSVTLYQVRPSVIALAFLMSIGGHVAMIGSFYLTARAVCPGDELPTLIEHIQLIPAAALAGVLIPLPGGVGAMEGAVAQLYKLAGAGTANGISASVAYRLSSILLALVGTALGTLWCRQSARAEMAAKEVKPIAFPPGAAVHAEPAVK